jgi:hypothetical protein
MSDTDLQELAAAIRKKKGFADLERKASIAKETEAWPQLVFKDRADMEAFRDILREEKGSPEYNTALHQLTLTQMKEQGTAEDRKMAEEMEEAEQRMAEFFTRALQEAKKEGRLK